MLQDRRSHETLHHVIKEQQDMTVQNPQLQTAKKIVKISDIHRDRVAMDWKSETARIEEKRTDELNSWSSDGWMAATRGAEWEKMKEGAKEGEQGKRDETDLQQGGRRQNSPLVGDTKSNDATIEVERSQKL